MPCLLFSLSLTSLLPHQFHIPFLFCCCCRCCFVFIISLSSFFSFAFSFLSFLVLLRFMTLKNDHRTKKQHRRKSRREEEETSFFNSSGLLSFSLPSLHLYFDSPVGQRAEIPRNNFPLPPSPSLLPYLSPVRSFAKSPLKKQISNGIECDRIRRLVSSAARQLPALTVKLDRYNKKTEKQEKEKKYQYIIQSNFPGLAHF